MVDRIGSSGASLARAAIEAALKRQAEAGARLENAAGALPGAEHGAAGAKGADASSFSTALTKGVEALNSEVQAADQLTADVLQGRVSDFHEVAARLKQSELSLQFALEVRNKFIDAYREVMRMSV